MRICNERKIMQTTAIKCDRCGKSCDLENSYEAMEAGEFLSHADTGGYASPHGDGTSWSIDLCAPCTIEVLSQWIRREE